LLKRKCETGANPCSWPCPTHKAGPDHNRPTYGSKEGCFVQGEVWSPSITARSWCLRRR